MSNDFKNIKVLDCTIRDGGYLNNWNFDFHLVRDVYRSVSKSGIDYFEIGFRNRTRDGMAETGNLWKCVNDKLVRDVVCNIQGAKVGIMGDFGSVEADDFCEKRESPISLVRVAAHKDNTQRAIRLLESIKKKGYEVSLQCMGFSNYSDTEKKELRMAVASSGLDYLYIADSYGSLFPFEIRAIFEPFLEMEKFKVGFHAHNNLQMAFANTLEAVRVGVDIVDSSIYGMGRGAGNLQSEILLAYLQKRGIIKYNVIPILECVDKYFVGLMEKLRWGYQLPYMISGVSKCHPFYAKDFLDRREYTIEKIWKALALIEKVNPVGYKKDIVTDMVARGLVGLKGCTQISNTSGSIDDIKVQEHGEPAYINRHEGRDFLVLANGTSLNTRKYEIDAFICKYNPIILGANNLANLYQPDYHAFNNERRLVSYVDQVKPSSKILIGSNISGELVSEYVSRDYERLVFRNVGNKKFDVKSGVIMADCRTVSVLLVAVAVVMGARRIFIAGMDGYLNAKSLRGGLYYDEAFATSDQAINIETHYMNERYLEQIDEYVRKNGGEGLHIITPTTHERFYKGIDNYI